MELTPPKRFGSKAQPVKAWAVYIIEPKPDETVDSPIEWLLITTVPTKSFKDARQRVEWYAKRWGIEVYHRTLKSGCRIKDRQLGDADRIETCLAIDIYLKESSTSSGTANIEQSGFGWLALWAVISAENTMAPRH